MSQPEPTNLPGAPAIAIAYPRAIRDAAGDPRALEQLYGSARQARQSEQFSSALLTAYHDTPDNLLYAAWFYRLQPSEQGERPSLLGGVWRWAITVGLILALALWLLSDSSLALRTSSGKVPYLAFLIAPLVALAILAVLAASGGRHLWRTAGLGVLLAAIAGYALAIAPQQTSGQQTLVLLHLPLLAAGAIGLALVGWRSSAASRFAFLTKAIEAVGTGGVYGIAGGAFVAITVGLFSALSITIPDVLTRLLVASVAGLLPLLAVATVYDPTIEPTAQDFGRGFGKILIVLMRALLAFSLIVLVIYVAVIPFNFTEPFIHRDVLIVYNVMLFGIIALLVGATPMTTDDLAPRTQAPLRAGIIAVAALTALVSLYALAAILYRTFDGGLTLNRAAVIGWNVINIGILFLLLVRQLRANRADWASAIQSALALGAYAYLIWAAFVALALPWAF